MRHRARLISRRLTVSLGLDAAVTREAPIDPEHQLTLQAHQLQQVQAELERHAAASAHLSDRVAAADAKLEVLARGALATAGRTSPATPRRLVIVDDAFPHLLSAFRIAEYNAYLDAWDDAVVLSTGSSFGLLGGPASFDEVVDRYLRRYPRFRGRVLPFDGSTDLAESLVYVMFLNNASAFLDAIHAFNVPFVMTLYPGGGLRLDQPDSDSALRRVCSSPRLERIIVTQRIVHEYLLSKELCDPARIAFIYGGVYPSSALARDAGERVHHRDGKTTFDVCFVGHRYMARGADKGYDVFIDVAKRLAAAYEDVAYHVVGPFDEGDVPIGGLEGRITFHGTRPTDFFPAFYARMDAIVSPNAPFLLAPGAFDIFPLGTCIEAGSCGVAVFCTDPLGQNVAFRDREELIIVPRDAGPIATTLGWYHDHPDELQRLSQRGAAAFRRVFDLGSQMGPRLELLGGLLQRDASERALSFGATRPVRERADLPTA